MSKSTPKAKGIRSAYQVVAGAITTYFVGLIAIPEVQEYTVNYVQNQGVTALFLLLGTLGVSTGVIAYIQNRVEDR